MKKIIAVFLAVNMVLLYCGNVLAEIIHLKDGSITKGEIIETLQDSIKVKTKFGDITIPKSDIEKIEYEEEKEKEKKVELAKKFTVVFIMGDNKPAEFTVKGIPKRYKSWDIFYGETKISKMNFLQILGREKEWDNGKLICGTVGVSAAAVITIIPTKDVLLLISGILFLIGGSIDLYQAAPPNWLDLEKTVEIARGYNIINKFDDPNPVIIQSISQ